MLCPSCGRDNRPDRNYCADCGAPLGLTCASCGSPHEPDERFCGKCGAPLASSPAAAPGTLSCPRCGLSNPLQASFCNGCATSLAGEASVSTQAAPTPSRSSAVQSTQPSSFATGRYQIARALGEGGRKRVYLAHDTVLDRDVALAVIKTEGLDEASRSRVTRAA